MEVTFSKQKLFMIAKDFLKMDWKTGDTNGYVMRISVDDFLKLTTPDDEAIDRIMSEPPSTSNFEPYEVVKSEFDLQEFNVNAPYAVPNLRLNEDGFVCSHEGRHRAALMKKSGIDSMPVVLELDGGRGAIGSSLTKNIYPQNFGEHQGKELHRKNFSVSVDNAVLVNINSLELAEDALNSEENTLRAS